MQERRIGCLLLLATLATPAGWSQGLMEYGGLRAGAGGLGAGLSASLGHGKVVRRTYKTVVEAQQAALAQTKIVDQYFKSGCQYEAKKQWAYAEAAFNYVLQVMALRDGPGSEKSVPVLRHLVTTSKEGNNLDQAVKYQKNILVIA